MTTQVRLKVAVHSKLIMSAEKQTMFFNSKIDLVLYSCSVELFEGKVDAMMDIECLGPKGVAVVQRKAGVENNDTEDTFAFVVFNLVSKQVVHLPIQMS